MDIVALYSNPTIYLLIFHCFYDFIYIIFLYIVIIISMYRIPFFVLLICLSMFTQWDVSVSAAPASVSTFRELGIELRENIADTYYV